MQFYVNAPPPVYYLDAHDAFNALSSTEKEYLYHCTHTSWIGGLLVLLQTSPESGGIFLFIWHLFKNESVDSLVMKARNHGFLDVEIENAFSYFATFLGNLGNYMSFGDTKFVPALSRDRMTELVSLSNEFHDAKSKLATLWSEISPAIYSLHARRLRLGLAPSGITTYYSDDCTKDDLELVQKFLESTKTEAYNTRVFKSSADNVTLTIRFASADKRIVHPQSFISLPQQTSLQLEYGDYSEIMDLLTKSAMETSLHALNDTESEMWTSYAESFSQGDTNLHKKGSELWVADRNPVVETYIGFIESYRDPFGVRAEFEGFSAIVNKPMSAKFQALVANAVELISFLPWPPSYEKDRFLKPDFTSLDVVTFASSGIPVGINIPNYDDIRQVHGFKNVSLGNVLSARFKDKKTDFICDADKTIYLENIATAFEIQVGLHELLGHGSGKLFQRYADGTFNFDAQTTTDLLTGGPVTTWYEPGETWDGKFGSLSSSMEECRAECVGIYLCSSRTVLKLFDQNVGDSWEDLPDVVYVNWLSMVHSGLTSMEFYTPASCGNEKGTWRQAHCCARYTILRVLLEAGESLVRIEEIVNEDGAPDLSIFLDRQKILTVGRPAIANLLKHLQYYKSTGNSKDGMKYFAKHSDLLSEHMNLRKIVIERKKPRPIFVQPGMKKSSNGIELIRYPSTYAGMIQSFVDRFANLPLGSQALKALEVLWRREQSVFKSVPL